MGNDGGSIPDRRDLVKTKGKAEQADKANQTRARWFFCALSKRPLQEPIVSCALGKLYNKDAILEFLARQVGIRRRERDMWAHKVTKGKDVKTLKLTPNPAPSVFSSSTDRAQFVCPFTLKEMNGGVPFVYIATCGCVLSQAGFKALATKTGSLSPPPSGEDRGKEKDGGKNDTETKQLDLCPQCGAKYDRVMDVFTINPDPATEEIMLAAMVKRREKASNGKKKSKKRKAGETEADVELSVESKKAKPQPTVNPSIAAASRAVAASLAEEEVKRKAGMSDAVRSLYESKTKGKKEGDSAWMQRTFNRYA